jgi:hypothetical protein
MMARFDYNQIRIATPCPASWADMKGDERVRHCSLCKLNVYNLAELPAEEAEALMKKSARGERVCMRLLRRADGTVITRDCPVGVSLQRRVRLKLAALRLAATSILMWFGGAGGLASAQELTGKVVAPAEMKMGEMVAPPVKPDPKSGTGKPKADNGNQKQDPYSEALGQSAVGPEAHKSGK